MTKESFVATNREMSGLGVKTPELEKKSSVGIVVAVVKIDRSKNGENAQDPMIWTIVERKSKEFTTKRAGQISLPAETKKNGENGFSNMLGALPEFSDNGALIRSLTFMPSSYVEGKLTVAGGLSDLAILILDDFPNEQIAPLDKDEVSPNGWMSLGDLGREREINSPHLRDVLVQTVDLERKDGVICGVVADYLNYPEKRVPISTFLPLGTSLSEFYKKREQLLDVGANFKTICQVKSK